jgi:hypothetical protein
MTLLLTARNASPKGLMSREVTPQASLHLGPPAPHFKYFTPLVTALFPYAADSGEGDIRGEVTVYQVEQLLALKYSHHSSQVTISLGLILSWYYTFPNVRYSDFSRVF